MLKIVLMITITPFREKKMMSVEATQNIVAAMNIFTLMPANR